MKAQASPPARATGHRPSPAPRRPEPVQADLKESGSIEQDADVVMFLHPAEQRKGYKATPTKCIIAKNRNGPLGSALFAFHQTQGRFYEAAKEGVA